MGFTSISEIKQTNASAGKHFFDADTMRFFRSRVCETIEALPDGSALFVSSEQYVSSDYKHVAPRKWSVRHARLDGSVDEVGSFQFYSTRKQAVGAMKRFADWLRSAFPNQNLIEPIISRMQAEQALDLSDAEIERTLNPCVAGPGLVRIAKQYRDAGILTIHSLRRPA